MCRQTQDRVLGLFALARYSGDVNSQREWPSVGTMETSRPPSLLGAGVQRRQLMIRSVSSVPLVKRSSWLLNIK